jgi:hypothetical protein
MDTDEGWDEDEDGAEPQQNIQRPELTHIDPRLIHGSQDHQAQANVHVTTSFAIPHFTNNLSTGHPAFG